MEESLVCEFTKYKGSLGKLGMTESMLVKSNNKLDPIRRLLQRELGNLAKDFTHIEPKGDFYHAVLKNGHRVLIMVNKPGERADLTEVGGKIEIFRSRLTARSKWMVPMVLWEYTTPNVLAQTYLKQPALADILYRRAKSGAAKKYIARYLLAWFVDQLCVSGHFLATPSLDDFFIAAGRGVGSNNYLSVAFLEPKERRLLAALLFAVLKGERALAVEIILAQHYRVVHPHHTHKSGLHLTSRAANTAVKELQMIFTASEEGNINIPSSLIEAAASLRSLEIMISAFDEEADLAGNLLAILQSQLPAIFKLKKDATPQAVASLVMN